jgi:hypothetical protein
MQLRQIACSPLLHKKHALFRLRLNSIFCPTPLPMAAFTLLTVALVLAAAVLASSGVRLLQNYLSARTMGVPIRFIPISPLNPFWVLLDNKILPLFRRLPFGDNSFTRYNWRGWEVADRYRSHTEMGDIWVLVTPFKNWVYINDPAAITSMYKRGSDFPRPGFISGTTRNYYKSTRSCVNHEMLTTDQS